MATWLLKRSFLLLIFIYFACIGISLANIREQYNQHDSFHMVQGKTFDFESLGEDLSVNHKRRKRDIPVQDAKCIEQNGKVQANEGEGFHYEQTLQDSTLQSLSLSWRKDIILAATTEEDDYGIFAKPSKVFISTDGGKTFTLHTGSELNDVMIKKANGLQKHPRDPDRVYMMAYSKGTGGSILFTSVDAGKTFEKHVLEFNLHQNLMFHSSKNDVIMTVATDKVLYVSSDNGNTWASVKDKVIDAKWQPDEDSIYCSVTVQDDQFDIMALFGFLLPQTRDYDLEVSHDLGKSWTKIHKHIYSFGVQGKFIYVSTYLSAKDESNDKRMMEVSTNKGKTWNAVQLPAIEPDRFFSILDMSYDMVFLHVDEPDNSGFGTLFTSDSTGILYSKSLEHHLYPNFQDVTDFYRVQGMRGVYFASQMNPDNSVHTMITFDRGAEWLPIPRPEGVACQDESQSCYLQIHGLFSRINNVKANLPLSTENAKGLILTHAHIASSLQRTEPDVFLSTNGGYDWKKVLTGAHHYQIADQGGLIVAVPLEVHPRVIKYSTDEGNCWHEFTFTDKNITVTGLLTEPGNKAMGVAVWGYTAERKWVVHTFNFSKIVTKPCDRNADYETWQPHAKNQHQGCFLGKKEKFTKIKKDSFCHNEIALDEQTLQENCLCTSADYDCDYGYYRVGGSEACVLDPMFKGDKLEICERNHVEEIVTQGYHRIPGDTCVLKDSSFHKAEHKMIDMKKTCAEGDLTLIEGEIKKQYLPKEEPSKMRTNTVVLVVAITILLLVGVIVVAFFAHRNLFNRSGSYRYSMLRVSDYDNDLDGAIAAHTSLYDDMSDEETQPIKSSKSPSTSAPKLQNGVLPRFDSMASSRPPMQITSTGSSGVLSSQAMGPPSSDKPGRNADTQSKPKVKSYHDDSDVDLLE